MVNFAQRSDLLLDGLKALWEKDRMMVTSIYHFPIVHISHLI